jgi:hypothetical protein
MKVIHPTYVSEQEMGGSNDEQAGSSYTVSKEL